MSKITARNCGQFFERLEDVLPLEDLLCVGLYRPLDGAIGKTVVDVVDRDIPPGAAIGRARLEQVLLADGGERIAPIGEPHEPERRSSRENRLGRAQLDAERGADIGKRARPGGEQREQLQPVCGEHRVITEDAEDYIRNQTVIERLLHFDRRRALHDFPPPLCFSGLFAENLGRSRRIMLSR
jgi:hypothetical protein